jgi:hypothetical protein
MDIRSLILVDATNNGDKLPFVRTPLAMVDVAGASALERLADRLHRFKISPITIVVEGPDGESRSRQPHGAICLSASTNRFWHVAESAFNELAQNADLVLLLRLGAYAEIDFPGLVQFHVKRNSRVSQGAWRAEHLEVFCLNASRRNDAASLFRSRLSQCRTECEFFAHGGYINPLSGPHDLRQFCIDVLTKKTETPPAGMEIKPGIWAAPRASIEKGSHIVAPAFIGSSAQIRRGAVITRCTSIERHAQVDCGTVVENSTVLPYVYVGAGLDLAHSVAGGGYIANLRRSVMVDVTDEKLLGQVSFTNGSSLLGMASRIPAMILSGLFGNGTPHAPSVNGDLSGPATATELAAPDAKAGDTVSNLAVARRYGDQ